MRKQTEHTRNIYDGRAGSLRIHLIQFTSEAKYAFRSSENCVQILSVCG